MLSQQDVDLFRKQGYLVVENLLDDATLESIRTEYAGLMDRLYQGWFDQGLVASPPDGMGFWDKLDVAFRGGEERREEQRCHHRRDDQVEFPKPD